MAEVRTPVLSASLIKSLFQAKPATLLLPVAIFFFLWCANILQYPIPSVSYLRVARTVYVILYMYIIYIQGWVIPYCSFSIARPTFCEVPK